MKFAELPLPVDDHSLAPWTRAWAAAPRPWMLVVKAFLRAAARDAPAFLRASSRARVSQFGQAVAPAQAPPDAHVCLECGSAYASRRALTAHAWQAHGLRCDAGAYVDGSTCPSCGWRFASRVRCIHHVRYGTIACRVAWLEGTLPRVAPERLLELQLADREHRRLCRQLGVSELAGHAPLPPVEAVEVVP